MNVESDRIIDIPFCNKCLSIMHILKDVPRDIRNLKRYSLYILWTFFHIFKFLPPTPTEEKKDTKKEGFLLIIFIKEILPFFSRILPEKTLLLKKLVKKTCAISAVKKQFTHFWGYEPTLVISGVQNHINLQNHQIWGKFLKYFNLKTKIYQTNTIWKPQSFLYIFLMSWVINIAYELGAYVDKGNIDCAFQEEEEKIRRKEIQNILCRIKVCAIFFFVVFWQKCASIFCILQNTLTDSLVSSYWVCFCVNDALKSVLLVTLLQKRTHAKSDSCVSIFCC